jgi:hypothetical protein
MESRPELVASRSLVDLPCACFARLSSTSLRETAVPVLGCVCACWRLVLLPFGCGRVAVALFEWLFGLFAPLAANCSCLLLLRTRSSCTLRVALVRWSFLAPVASGDFQWTVQRFYDCVALVGTASYGRKSALSPSPGFKIRYPSFHRSDLVETWTVAGSCWVLQ